MIYKKYKLFKLCFIFILSYSFFKFESFTPEECIGHFSILIGDKLYFFGRIMRELTTDKNANILHVYSFNLNSLIWNVLNIKVIPLKRCKNVKGVIDNTGKIYIFSEAADKGSNLLITDFFNDMVILDTVKSSWFISDSVNSLIVRHSYTATLLLSGVIVYVGG